MSPPLIFRNPERLAYTYELKKQLADEIRKECDKRGWGPYRLAKYLGTSHSETSKILGGQHERSSLDRFVMILYALGHRPTVTLDRPPAPPQRKPSADMCELVHRGEML